MRNILKLGSVSDEDVERDADAKDMDFVIESGYFNGMDDECNSCSEE